MRITAQLISVRDGFQVWSHTFDQADNNLIEIQESIAKEVVRALELKLSIASRNRLVQLPTPQASAYELYLLGRFQQLQRKPEALARAIEYHQQALVIDPKFALAYSGLADAYMASVYYSNRPLAQAAVDVEHAVAQALAIDPQLAEAYAARGVLRTEQWQLNAAIDDLKRAVALKPNYADAIVRLGAAYEYAAQPRDALAAFDQAAVLDPLSVSLHVRRCLTLQNVGQYAAASTACARAIELQPIIPNGLWARGLIALAQGKTDAAIKGYREALAQSPQRADLLAQLGRLYLDLGLLDDARQSFDASVAAGYDEPTLQLERTYFFVAGRDSNVFTTYFKSIDLQKFQDQHDAIEAALFALVAGDTAKARLLVDRALKSPDYSHDALLKDVWMTRWGRSSVLTLAQVALASGDHASADKMIGEVLDWVVRVERNGQVWYGAEYLKASALALRGDSDAAIVSLKKARDLGWRSTWWMRVDPALKTLRDRADFVTLLSQMEAANAVARKNLQAVTQ